MAPSHAVWLFLILSSYITFGTAQIICNTHTWDSRVLHEYCTVAGGAAYGSPACSIYRLCDKSSAASPFLGAGLCSLDRLFVTLCADRPELPECTTSQLHPTSTPGQARCVRVTGLELWSTEAVRSALVALCSRDSGSSVTAVCKVCNADKCDTPDPLLAYTALCTENPTATDCKAWAAFCAKETPAMAAALCLSPDAAVLAGTGRAHIALRSAAGVQVSPPPPADPCIQEARQESCKAYTYPKSSALADIDRLCGSMPDMPGCAIARACESGQHRVADKYCLPFVLLATLCHDMPGMRGCENYKALCKQGSVVQQCIVEGPVPHAPTWSQARKAVFGACDDHPMGGCANCTSNNCPDPLASLADICHEMPEMAACNGFWAFCEAAGPQDVAEWCGEDDSKYLPSMLMYFHQRTQELLLWKEWRPRTQGQYLASVLIIILMGVVATGLKTAKGALVLQWNHQRALKSEELRVVSVWMPRNDQITEIVAKSALTGVSLTLDYFNMLIAMTFNVGFFCAVIAGYIAGTLLFGHVLENYAAILHQRRRDVAAHLKRRRLGEAGVISGGSGSAVSLLANGNGVNGGAAALGVQMIEQEEEDAEEKLLMVVEGEGDCNCVHSA
ncbi:hypothetical protein Vafri_7238 [Volvox africanus]|uniref:Copper transporter n=1 Tax=Volvox africanus TaxID=51714 RepID=A0A8J4AZY4_9CHLO|nr:hypothetical protein Vafri_7238 [Volvox africanus]